MTPTIEHVQNIIEDRLIDITSEVQSFSVESNQYWYHVGKFDAYHEMYDIFRVNLPENLQ